MNFDIETERLFLRVLTPDYASETLDFYKRNAKIFEKYEPIIGENFYTRAHHQHILSHEYKETLNLHMLRFWIFKKEDDTHPIGTLSFHNITPDIFSYATVGYKMDPSVWRKGYCYEALNASIEFVETEIGIRRFEALVLPDNTPSIHLLEKLGFQREGLLRDKVFLQGKWRDHFLYSYISDDKF